jgi:hypothetical protein
MDIFLTAERLEILRDCAPVADIDTFLLNNLLVFPLPPKCRLEFEEVDGGYRVWLGKRYPQRLMVVTQETYELLIA